MNRGFVGFIGDCIRFIGREGGVCRVEGLGFRVWGYLGFRHIGFVGRMENDIAEQVEDDMETRIM